MRFKFIKLTFCSVFLLWCDICRGEIQNYLYLIIIVVHIHLRSIIQPLIKKLLEKKNIEFYTSVVHG